jgi:acyl-coenzyme A synthetase/AMP-(fatty) acid ligase
VEGGAGTISADHLEHPVELEDVLETKPDGTFRIVGRSSDIVNVAGKRGSLAELTTRLQEVRGVRDAVVFVPRSVNDSELNRLCGLVVCDRPVKDVLRDFAMFVDPVFLPRPLIDVARLPRSETGKLDRGALDAMWAEVRPDEL